MSNPYQTPVLGDINTEDSISFASVTHCSCRQRIPVGGIAAYLFLIVIAGFANFAALSVDDINLLWRAAALASSAGALVYSFSRIHQLWRQQHGAKTMFSPSHGVLNATTLYIDSGDLKQEICLVSLQEIRRIIRPPFRRFFVFCWDETVLGRHAFHSNDFNSREAFRRFYGRIRHPFGWSHMPARDDLNFAPSEFILPMPKLKSRSVGSVPVPLVLPEFSGQITGEGQFERFDFSSPVIQELRSNRRWRITVWYVSWIVVVTLMFLPTELMYCIGPIAGTTVGALLIPELRDAYGQKRTAIRYAVAIHPEGVAWATGSVINQAKWAVFRSYVIEKERLLLEIVVGDSFLLIPKHFFAESRTAGQDKDFAWRQALELVQANLPARESIDPASDTVAG